MLRKLKQSLLTWFMRSLAKPHQQKRIPDDVNKIGIWQFGGLGDMLLTTPVIEAMSQKYPNAEIHIWCSTPAFADFLTRFAQVKAIHALNIYDFDMRTLCKSKKRKALNKQLKLMQGVHIDVLLNLHVPNQLDWWAVEWMLIHDLQPSFSMGFNPPFIHDVSVTDVSLNVTACEGLHYTNMYQKLLAAADIPCDLQTQFPIHAIETDEAKHLLSSVDVGEEQKWICLHIGGRRLNLENKMWPVASFASLAEKLLQAGITPVLIGVENELGMGEELRAVVPGVRTLIGQTTMGQMAALMTLSRGFIGHDSGPSHIAVAANIPTVVICGRPDAEPEYINYQQSHVQVLTGDHPDDIAVEDVLKAMVQVSP